MIFGVIYEVCGELRRRRSCSGTLEGMGELAKEDSGSHWKASTNWLVADGSLDGSVSFDTSISADAVDSTSSGVLLESSEDSLPCEITIFFREKHEIHSIYVRSTARIYEIYYASDQQVSSNEYLCTVRCGPAAPTSTEDRYDGKPVLPSGDSKAVEEGWVEIEVPDSILQDSNRLLLSKMCYEATAEISDAPACMSIALRLLSLELKTSVYVEEIYIYADPVEDTDPNPLPPISNTGVGSLLSMLVPSVLQLSTYSSPLGKSIPMNGPDSKKITGDNMTEEHSQGKTVKSAEENGSNQFSNSTTVRLEEILHDLGSRIGRIETFCSSFQENVIKPLTGIDTRLQRMEEQIDALTKGLRSSKTCSTKVLSPEFSDHESNSEKECCPSSFVVDSSSQGNEAPDKFFNAFPELQRCTGLLVKAPEFPNEEDDDRDVGNDISKLSCDFVDLTSEVHPNNWKYSSIDNALALELAAFHISATEKLSELQSGMIDVPKEQNCGSYSYRREARVVGDNLDGEFFLFNDDSSTEFDANESKGLTIRAPDFPNEDILDCGCDSTSSPRSVEPSKCNSNLPTDSPSFTVFLSQGGSKQNYDRNNFHDWEEQSFDFSSWMKSQLENRHVASVDLGEDDFISNVKFTADERLKTSLPLEFLLGEEEEPNEKVQSDDDQLKDMSSSIPEQFSVDRNLRRESSEVLQDENPSQGLKPESSKTMS